MKKFITAVLLLLMSSKGFGLTLQECQGFSDEYIINQLMESLVLGAQSGGGNQACMKEAKELNVQLLNQQLSGAPTEVIKEYRVVGVGKPTEATLYLPVVYFEAKTLKNKVIRGKFTYERNDNLMYPEQSFHRKKCASIGESPEPYIVLERCAFGQ